MSEGPCTCIKRFMVACHFYQFPISQYQNTRITHIGNRQQVFHWFFLGQLLVNLGSSLLIERKDCLKHTYLNAGNCCFLIRDGRLLLHVRKGCCARALNMRLCDHARCGRTRHLPREVGVKEVTMRLLSMPKVLMCLFVHTSSWDSNHLSNSMKQECTCSSVKEGNASSRTGNSLAHFIATIFPLEMHYTAHSVKHPLLCFEICKQKYLSAHQTRQRSQCQVDVARTALWSGHLPSLASNPDRKHKKKKRGGE